MDIYDWIQGEIDFWKIIEFKAVLLGICPAKYDDLKTHEHITDSDIVAVVCIDSAKAAANVLMREDCEGKSLVPVNKGGPHHPEQDAEQFLLAVWVGRTYNLKVCSTSQPDDCELVTLREVWNTAGHMHSYHDFEFFVCAKTNERLIPICATKVYGLEYAMDSASCCSKQVIYDFCLNDNCVSQLNQIKTAWAEA